MTKKEPCTIVEAFTKKIHAAIKGDNIAEDINEAVMGLLKAYELPIPGYEPKYYKKPEHHCEPQYKTNNHTYPIQKGHFYFGK